MKPDEWQRRQAELDAAEDACVAKQAEARAAHAAAMEAVRKADRDTALAALENADELLGEAAQLRAIALSATEKPIRDLRAERGRRVGAQLAARRRPS